MTLQKFYCNPGTNVSTLYRHPCLWSYENIISSGVAPGGWVFNNENFVWRVCNFE